MKGLTYVGIDPAAAGSPAVASMARELNLSRYEVVGRLPAFYGAVASHAEDGQIAQFPDELLDDWAGNVPGWGASVRRHMLDDAGVLQDWFELNGRALANLAKDRKRQRDRRRGQSKDAPQTPPGSSEDSPRTDGGESTGNTGTHTETIHPSPSTARARERVDGFMARVMAEVPDFADDFAGAFRAHRHPESLVAELEALQQGFNAPAGAPVSLPVIAQALRDIRVNSEPLKATTLRTFIGRLLRPDRTRPPATTSTTPRPARTRVPEL